ncbi:catalase [Luteipulveratus halotolerans]|uniref:Catalase n=1 Tax=Luteipulveratus halotolerans TaxID=1631356 RepID=A0A0L6CPY8_9MICO|nr:catalase [Luteipulveratus halotolerans]
MHAAQDAIEPPAPGAPGSEPPTVREPTEPREPAEPKHDQGSPATRTPTGAETSTGPEQVGQQGAHLTTAQGARLRDTDHSLKAGARGPTLLQDHHLREKIMHFDHERIPERVVHARGAAAHGVFVGYGNAESVCRATFLGKDVKTPVFTRFSPVVGSRGSADAVRDTRGFATKFYTDEGVFDLVGNNIPVFFIQDAIKFPDVVHAAKPHPDREIPQAQSAHDTFWDFVGLHTEASHHVMWQMSDRGIPRSYRMMEGFGVHTFRLVDASGGTSLVKFHWKPRLGVHSLVWEEAQLVNGVDPDFHRRDLADAIESGAPPQWELGIQVFPDTPEQTFEGIDLLDPTKVVPEELAPVQPVGLMTLDANPTNYFAETEQVAFHPGHLVPGIDVTDDPLLQGRLFSYLDTQLTRLGGPNFAQIPINRPHAPVNDMLRDGWHQDAVHSGAAPYKPNSLDGGCPFFAGADVEALTEVAATVPEGHKVRESPASYADHFTQPRMFFRSLSPVEQEHTIRAYTFELGRCYEEAIKERYLGVLAEIDADLCAGVARGLGLDVPSRGPTGDVGVQRAQDMPPSPALSQVGQEWPVAGRVVGIVVDTDTDRGQVDAVRRRAIGDGLVPLVIAAHGGQVDGTSVQRTFATTRSVELDAVLLASCPPPAPDADPVGDAGAAPLDPRIAVLLQEAFRHAKPIGAWGAGSAALDAAGIPRSAPGVVVDENADTVTPEVLALLGRHRVWERLTGASAS